MPGAARFQELPELVLGLLVERIVGPGRARAGAEQRVHDREERDVPGRHAGEGQRRCQRAFRIGGEVNRAQDVSEHAPRC